MALRLTPENRASLTFHRPPDPQVEKASAAADEQAARIKEAEQSIAALRADAAKADARLSSTLQAILAKQEKSGEKKDCKITFEFKRDKDGLIQSATATVRHSAHAGKE